MTEKNSVGRGVKTLVEALFEVNEVDQEAVLRTFVSGVLMVQPQRVRVRLVDSFLTLMETLGNRDFDSVREAMEYMEEHGS